MILTVSTMVAAFFLAQAGVSPGKEISSEDKGYKRVLDISYVAEDETDAYRLERCKLDLYYPETEGFATLVWLHGGGLEGGSKGLMDVFRRRGFAVVDVNYRLYPKALCPSYIEDAAQSVAWVFDHIVEYGGDPDKIYVAGHSAGGYLTLMVGLAKQYLAAYGVDADRIAKLYPVSGQAVTHYTIRKERGLPDGIPVIDEFAPMANVRPEGAPIMLITGDDDLEMLARYEENLHLYSLLKHFQHPAQLYQLEGFDHGTVLIPACTMIVYDIIRLTHENDTLSQN